MKNGKKVFLRDLIVVLLALSALACAAINLYVSVHMLGKSEEDA